MEILIVILIILAGLALAFVLSSRCPQCRRFLALNFTDNYRTIEKLGVPVRQREVVCGVCKHRFWRKHREYDTANG